MGRKADRAAAAAGYILLGLVLVELVVCGLAAYAVAHLLGLVA